MGKRKPIFFLVFLNLSKLTNFRLIIAWFFLLSIGFRIIFVDFATGYEKSDFDRGSFRLDNPSLFLYII